MNYFLILAIWDLFMGHLDKPIFALTEWLLIAHTENGYFGTKFFIDNLLEKNADVQ